jgi:hypothetical protein
MESGFFRFNGSRKLTQTTKHIWMQMFSYDKSNPETKQTQKRLYIIKTMVIHYDLETLPISKYKHPSYK